MTHPEHFERVGSLFNAASKLSGENRRAWLKAQCAGDVDLLREVEDLLERADGAESTSLFTGSTAVKSVFSDLVRAAESGLHPSTPPRMIGGYEISRFLKMELVDYGIAAMIVVSLSILRIEGKALKANVALQLGAFITAAPLLFSLAFRNGREQSLPWMCWSVGYALQAVIVLGRTDSWEELAFPLCGLSTHFAIGLLAWCVGPRHWCGSRT